MEVLIMALLDADKRFNDKNGYGFISKEDGSRNICVYYSVVVGGEGYKMLDGIESVEFKVERVLKAKNVKKIKPAIPIYPLD
jgi:cold shock CspA family protein